jgi:hypothetical protein
MTNRTHAGFLPLLLAVGLAGCNGADTPLPSAPSAQPEQTLARADSGGATYYMTNVTLSGVFYEVTRTGRVPIEGVQYWSSEQAQGFTDINGSFRVRPVWVCPCSRIPSVESGITSIQWGKDGYDDPPGQPDSIFHFLPEAVTSGSGWRDVKINGDTRLDIELVPALRP